MTAAPGGRQLPANPTFITPLTASFEVPKPGTSESYTVAIGPATVSQLAAVMAESADLLDIVRAITPDRRERFMAGAPSVEDLDVMLTLLQDQGDMAIRVVSTLSCISADHVGALLPDRFAWLFALVVMVNADFFSRSPAAFAAAGQLLAQARGAGKPGVAAQTGRPSSPP